MQSFAIIPAAGRSERMGRPKLLLPWGRSTVIEQVIGAWRASDVAQVVMVVHPDDAQLAQVGRDCGALVVQPKVAPEEMKVSVRLALDRIAKDFQPQQTDAWLLAPADMPTLSAAVINRLLEAYRTGLVSTAAEGIAPSPIWVPRYEGRRGHPVLFAWSLAQQVERLADDEGLNALVARNPVGYLSIDDESICEDLDTPEDYERLWTRYGQ